MAFEPTSTPYRCAVYFVPAPESLWWHAGSTWLGRCAASGDRTPALDIDGVDSLVLEACTAEPRRYGWHATLKAPFILAADQTMDTLCARVREVAASFQAFDLPALRVSAQGDFLALRPVGDVTRIHAVAAACVTRLQALSAPLSAAELSRRRLAPLTPEQDRLLLEWGYPWVLSHFQFHMSLTGRLNALRPAERAALMQAAQVHFESLPVCRFSHLALFTESLPGSDFKLLEHMALQA
jgi:hypothetical protein